MRALIPPLLLAAGCVTYASIPTVERSTPPARDYLFDPAVITVQGEVQGRTWLMDEATLSTDELEQWRRIVIEEFEGSGWFRSAALADDKPLQRDPPEEANRVTVHVLRGQVYDSWVGYSMLLPARSADHWFVTMTVEDAVRVEYGKLTTVYWSPLIVALPFFTRGNAREQLLRAMVRALMVDQAGEFSG